MTTVNETRANVSSAAGVQFAALGAVPQLSTPLFNGLMACLGSLAIPLNLALMVRLRQAWKHKQAASSVLNILNVSIADCLIATTVPLRIMDLTNNIAWTKNTCNLYIFFRYFSVYLAVNTKVLLSMESFFALIYPTRFKILTSRRSIFLQHLLVWAFSGLETCVPVTRATYARLQVVTGAMYYLCSPFTDAASIIYINVTFLLLPLTAIIAMYGKILTKIFLDKHPISQSHQANVRKKRMAKIILLIVVVFFLCWTPPSIIHMSYMNDTAGFFSSSWYTVFQVFGIVIFLHPVVNPVIFLTTNRRLMIPIACLKGNNPREMTGHQVASPRHIQVQPARGARLQSVSDRVHEIPLNQMQSRENGTTTDTFTKQAWIPTASSK